MANETLRFDLTGSDGGVPRMFQSVGDKATFAAKAARTLDTALRAEIRAAEESKRANDALARSEALLAASTDEAIKKAAEEDLALRRQADAAKKAADSQGGLLSSLKNIASEHDKSFKKLGGLGAGAGLFGLGAAGIGLAGPLGAATAALGAFGALALPTLTAVNKALDATGKNAKKLWQAMDPQQQQIAKSIFAFKQEFKDAGKAIEPLLGSLTKFAATALKGVLPALETLGKAGGAALQELLTPLAAFLSSGVFKTLAAQLGQLAVQAAKVLGPALAQLLRVFLRLFVQVGPAGIKLLQALLPAIVELTTDLTPVIVLVANLVAGFVSFLAQKHLLIPFLGLLAAAFLVLASSSGILGVVVAITVLIGAGAYLVKHWGAVWDAIKSITNTAWHWLYSNVFAKLITFFTKTIPTVLDIMKESVRIMWDEVKILFLKGVFVITGIMGHLPGPLGAPFRAAHKDIGNQLAGIQADVGKAAKNIQGDFDRLHGKHVLVNVDIGAPPKGKINAITRGFAAGTSGASPGWAWVGERGPELVKMTGGETVIPNHALGGYAAGTSGWNFADAFTPPVGVFERRVNNAVSTVENALGGALAKAVRNALSRELATGALPTGPTSHSAIVAENYARSILPAGWSWPALLSLWTGESGWNAYAVNPTSGAYGIPQSLGHGHPYNLGDYVAQINWGLRYIAQNYGSSQAAYSAWLGRSPHWYDQGGLLPTGLSLAYNGTGRPERVFSPRESAGGTININVHVSADASMHPAETGRIIADRLKAHVKRGGTVFPAGVSPR